jgi:hypothetical protein
MESGVEEEEWERKRVSYGCRGWAYALREARVGSAADTPLSAGTVYLLA